MSAALADIFASLERRHIATPQQPIPTPQIGVTWIWARNGMFKRGTDQHLDVLVPVQQWSPAAGPPGLASLLPSLRWRMRRGRLPGGLLPPLLAHARRAAGSTPVEQQYFVTWKDGTVGVTVPQQDATASRVRYEMPGGVTLLDLHSHHVMDAYFSPTDDQDDNGLSISAVIGRIFAATPTIVCRVNCYGQHHFVPALSVFETIAPFQDGGPHAAAHD